VRKEVNALYRELEIDIDGVFKVTHAFLPRVAARLYTYSERSMVSTALDAVLAMHS
jgi:hypothetical protein